ncbi:glycosyltransferase family 61 protein [Salinibacter ruber]|uniref:Capsular polysaccharide biosynthesis protein n=1 Tax=Salinibacter ruber TaxID=146919 RepID=A0A9X2Q5A0_9BACT|nr:glycosyltransferase family 61 protein [Salinibacter ruber]MCS3662073.1 capsular polysaccharide biosynthesis protein [Salinibacter ruber]MCS3711872.1 capsular polysaccharide biosynthesis protein [Salinibacter ruber]
MDLFLESLRGFPFSSEWIGPPTGREPSVARWTEGHRHAEFTLLRKERPIERSLPIRVGSGEVHPRFREVRKRPEPRVFLARIPDARVWGDPNVAVITPDDTVLEEVSKDFNRPGREHVVFAQQQLGSTQRLTGRSLLLATTEGRRYFHWMMDVLPRVKIAKQRYGLSDFDHIIVNPITSSFQRETLEKVGVDMSRITETRTDRQIKCEELVVPSLPRSNGQTPAWSVDFLRSVFCTDESQGRDRKIYVSRGRAERRRLRNEQELVGLLSENGYESFRPERHSISEQVCRIAQATHIFAPHGGGLTNLVFCQPNTLIVEVFPSHQNSPCFWQIAECVNADYRYAIEYDGKREPHVEEFEISKSTIERVI